MDSGEERAGVSLYETLGVDEGADIAEIRKAYKRKAQKLHPDKNPDPEAHIAMQAVEEAWRVLSDPVKKARYDRGQEPISDEKMLEQARQLVEAVFDQITSNSRWEIIPDLFDIVRQAINDSIAKGGQEARRAQSAAKKAARLRKRLKFKGKTGDDFLARHLDQVYIQRLNTERAIRTQIAVHELALDLLQNYEDTGHFTPEDGPMRITFFGTNTIINTGSSTT
jgi:curved DNA-binding protein CbpA